MDKQSGLSSNLSIIKSDPGLFENPILGQNIPKNELLFQSTNRTTTVDQLSLISQQSYQMEAQKKLSIQQNLGYVPAFDLPGHTDEPVCHVPIVGTCPDMCPELERHLRSAHQRVSVSFV